ncbi:MAG: hypothetical protein HC888_05485 [Candidatus Competibacteraceae bacterium]|nr:hypothetical protein [Candidatus Competibacteraceae bacterium]
MGRRTHRGGYNHPGNPAGRPGQSSAGAGCGQTAGAVLGGSSADGKAWYGLGAVHTAAYVNGIDAVEIVLPAEGQEAAPRVQLGVPPLSYAKRLESVSKQRAEHLAEAVRAFQAALECDGAIRTPSCWRLALRSTSAGIASPATPSAAQGRTFDVAAKEFGAEAHGGKTRF